MTLPSLRSLKISASLSAITRCLSSVTPAPVQLTFKVFETTPPLLMFHGMYGSKTNFKTVAKRLNERTKPVRRVLIVDNRNHGYSPHDPQHTYEALAEDIKALIVKLGFEKVALLGHSMGGKATLYFSVRYPSLVDRLIVSDISHITNFGPSEMVGILEALLAVKMPENVSYGKAKKTVDEQLKKTITNTWFRHFLLLNLKGGTDGKLVVSDMVYRWPSIDGKWLIVVADICRFLLFSIVSVLIEVDALYVTAVQRRSSQKN